MWAVVSIKEPIAVPMVANITGPGAVRAVANSIDRGRRVA